MLMAIIPFLLVVSHFGQTAARPSPLVDTAAHKSSLTISRDVCIIGGGASGTYTAIGLRDKGKSVAVIEAQSVLGGHTNTYTDPATSAKVDYGVVVYGNTSTVTSFFRRFNIPLIKGTVGPSTAAVKYYVDFRTGKNITGYAPADPTAAFGAYAAQLAKYPFLNTPGWNLPDPVPSELLIPFGDFVKRYKIDDAVSTISGYAQGFGDLLSIPTLYVLKYFSSNGAQTNSLMTARHDNSELYEKARVELGGDVFFNSTVIATDRHKNGVKIIAKTPGGIISISAKKLVISIPPLLSNLKGFDLSLTERDLFGQFLHGTYCTGLLRNTGIPDNVVVTGVGEDTPYNLPPGLKDFKFGAATALSDSAVKASIVSAILKLKAAGTISTASTPDFVAYKSHTPYAMRVSADAIKAGFYKNLTTLQGQKHTWWTGAAFDKHSSADLWAFTAGLLPAIAA
ncbi:MAG: hypothetical protein Q9225_005422 [Loekoesia sp. 1 TL-2023]